jgi:hypothetical protein
MFSLCRNSSIMLTQNSSLPHLPPLRGASHPLPLTSTASSNPFSCSAASSSRRNKKWYQTTSGLPAGSGRSEVSRPSQCAWTKRLTISDLHKTYIDDEHYNSGHGHAYTKYGIDADVGAVVIVRPDQCEFTDASTKHLLIGRRCFESHDYRGRCKHWSILQGMFDWAICKREWCRKDVKGAAVLNTAAWKQTLELPSVRCASRAHKYLSSLRSLAFFHITYALFDFPRMSSQSVSWSAPLLRLKTRKERKNDFRKPLFHFPKCYQRF